MLTFMIVVNDSGELKAVSSAELAAMFKSSAAPAGDLTEDLDKTLNAILDQRAIDAGEYDPSDNDTPVEFEASNHGIPEGYTKEY